LSPEILHPTGAEGGAALAWVCPLRRRTTSPAKNAAAKNAEECHDLNREKIKRKPRFKVCTAANTRDL